jgi:hypothetical protein
MSTKTHSLTRTLLLCGAIAGPLFILILLIQDYTVPGYDPRVYLLSLLELGEWGWVQSANFVLAGVLNLFYAAGLWRRLHPGPAGTWGPLLIGAYGLGLVVVGVCTTDPTTGYPPGALAPTSPSWHGAIHALGALVVFLVLSAVIAVFARYFLVRKERGWALYCVASVVLLLALFFSGINSVLLMARFVRFAILIGWIGASVIAIKLLSTPDTPQPTPQRTA